MSSGELANRMFPEIFSLRHFMRKQAASICRNGIWQVVFSNLQAKLDLLAEAVVA